jgi:cytochrome c553
MERGSGTAQSTDRTAGKELYLSTCSECHGPHAQGFAQLQSPNLRILEDWYIAAQMEAYAKGWRGTADGTDLPTLWMRSIATHISSPQELAGVIRYIGSIPPAALH